LTYRGISQSFVVVTGHCHEGMANAWERFAQVDTLVVLMGVKNRAHIAAELIKAGRAIDEPVAFVERGTTEREQFVETTLEHVAAGDVEVHNPAVMVVGKVVRLREKLR
jgi:uroporphyrin-III C-methyltransferase